VCARARACIVQGSESQGKGTRGLFILSFPFPSGSHSTSSLPCLDPSIRNTSTPAAIGDIVIFRLYTVGSQNVVPPPRAPSPSPVRFCRLFSYSSGPISPHRRLRENVEFPANIVQNIPRTTPAIRASHARAYGPGRFDPSEARVRRLLFVPN